MTEQKRSSAQTPPAVASAERAARLAGAAEHGGAAAAAPATRSIETAIEIEAPVDAVWKALTDAEELVRWFPLEASVVPGPGGVVRLSWGEALAGESRITIWEPNRRLCTVDAVAGHQWGVGGAAEVDRALTDPEEAAAKGVRLVSLDYRLEARGGSTHLRLVHSGFGAGADWDDEVDGVRRGWSFELRSLRHYLTRHRGVPRRAALLRRPFSGSAEEAWDRWMSPQGLLGDGRLQALREGDVFRSRTADGELLSGEIVVLDPPHQFAVTVESYGDGLLRTELASYAGRPELSVFVATWGVAGGEAAVIEERWRSRLERLFAGV